jgi:tetratricopeptide (TPR) repeat protein
MRWVCWLGALSGLLAVPGVRADLEKGTYAPDLEARDWMNTEQPISLRDMRGLIVVLYFWVSFHKGGEAFMEPINIVYNDRDIGRGRGVMVIGVTDAERKMVIGMLEREKVNFPVAFECKAYEEYKIKEFPRVVVVDPSGRVAFSGPPSDVENIRRAVFEVLADTPPTRTRPEETRYVQKRLEDARAALRQANYREAFQAARDAFEHAVTGDRLKSTCQDVLDLLDLIGRDRLAEADALVDERQFGKAVEAIRWVIRHFHGADVARDARKRMATLKKQYSEIAEVLKGHSSTVEAARLLGEAREAILAQRFGPAQDRLEKILKDYKDTEVAPIAEGILTRMRAHPRVTEELRNYAARRECEMLLAQARNFIASGRRPDAEKKLREVLERYPDTRYAQQAKEMLINLR